MLELIKLKNQTINQEPIANEQTPIGAHLVMSMCPAEQLVAAEVIASGLMHDYAVLTGNADGVKKDAAASLKLAITTTHKAHAKIAKQFMDEMSDNSWTVVQCYHQSYTEPAPVVTPVVTPVPVDVVADVVTPTPVTVPALDVVGMVADLVSSLRDEMMDAIETLRGSMVVAPTITPTPVVTPVVAPVVAPKPAKVAKEPRTVLTTEGGLTIRKYKPRSPKGWADKVNFSCAVVYDQVDPKGDNDHHMCAIVKGMTPEDATALARNMVRRALIGASGIEGLHKATQNTETWVAVAASSGITDAVCDMFITNPQKFTQQARRTADNLRATLAIDSKVAFGNVALAYISGASAPVVTPALPSLFAPTVTPVVAPVSTSVVATVSIDDIKALMADSGMSYMDAKAFLA